MPRPTGKVKARPRVPLSPPRPLLPHHLLAEEIMAMACRAHSLSFDDVFRTDLRPVLARPKLDPQKIFEARRAAVGAAVMLTRITARDISRLTGCPCTNVQRARDSFFDLSVTDKIRALCRVVAWLPVRTVS